MIGYTNDVEKYYKVADIFLFPSYGEGLSNAFIEALAHNLVCICYNNTSFPELKDLGFYFQMCTNLDVDALSLNVFTLYSQLNKEKKKSLSNYIKAKTIFSIQNELNSYKDILS